MSLMSWFRNLFSRSSGQPTAARAVKGAKAGKAAKVAVELGRNDLCWCGSGKKYKKCHLPTDSAEQREARFAELTAKNAKAKSGDGITRAKAKGATRPPENPDASRAAGGRR